MRVWWQLWRLSTIGWTQQWEPGQGHEQSRTTEGIRINWDFNYELKNDHISCSHFRLATSASSRGMSPSSSVRKLICHHIGVRYFQEHRCWVRHCSLHWHSYRQYGMCRMARNSYRAQCTMQLPISNAIDDVFREITNVMEKRQKKRKHNQPGAMRRSTKKWFLIAKKAGRILQRQWFQIQIRFKHL